MNNRVKWSAMKVLLVQIRDENNAITQEQECFCRTLNIEAEQLHAFNVIRDEYTTSILDGMNLVIIGGSGAYSATEEHPFYPKLDALIRDVMNLRLPTWGSCWGHQYLGRHFGGKVESDLNHFEFGTFEVHLTQEGEIDPVFSTMSPTYKVQQGHQDQVKVLPKGLTCLSYNENAAIQALKVDGYPIYGAQFHAEMTKQDMKDRMLVYKEHYPFETDEDFWAAWNGITETDCGRDLLLRFVRYFVADEEFIA